MGLEYLIYTLLTMFLSGLAFVAYRHPSSFPRIWDILLLLVGVVFVVALIWDGAVLQTYHSLLQFIGFENREQAEQRFNSLRLMHLNFFLYVFGFVLYTFVLRLLPLLGISSSKNGYKKED